MEEGGGGEIENNFFKNTRVAKSESKWSDIRFNEIKAHTAEADIVPKRNYFPERERERKYRYAKNAD